MTYDYKKQLGAAIRERRKFLNLTQLNLAKTAGINRSHLSLIETGEHRPSKRTLSEIARALDTTAEELESTGEFLAEAARTIRGRMYPGLWELLNDPDAITLYQITEEEKRILRTIRLQWNNPSKGFFIQALLDYRNSRKEG